MAKAEEPSLRINGCPTIVDATAGKAVDDAANTDGAAFCCANCGVADGSAELPHCSPCHANTPANATDAKPATRRQEPSLALINLD